MGGGTSVIQFSGRSASIEELVRGMSWYIEGSREFLEITQIENNTSDQLILGWCWKWKFTNYCEERK